MAREPVLFISHKHSDRKIASELHRFLDRWSRKEVRVFQSSDPLAEGPRLGNLLSAELKQALWDAGVILLIYTSPDQDWSWCMWECGVATKPGSPETRIIVLQASTEQPKVYADRVHVDLRDPGDVLKFVKEYLTDPEFFPSVGTAVAPRLSPDGPEVKEAAEDLYARLREVLPTREVAEWPAQPVLRLEVKAESGSKAVSAVKETADFAQNAVVCEMDPRAWHIFGLAQLETGMSIGALVKHWTEQSGRVAHDWAEDIHEQVLHAAMGEISVPRWTQLQEIDGKESYTPILTRVRQLPARDALQFDVSLVQFDVSRMTSTSSEPYQRELATAMKRIESAAPALLPFLLPVARRHLHGWSEYVRKLCSEGVDMSGPERLEITRLLVNAGKRYVIVEPMVSNPREMHSRDWGAYYHSLRERADVDKIWILCAKEDEVKSRLADVEESWKFRRDSGFRTLYCSPRDFELATGGAIPKQQVIEEFGAYVKLLSLPQETYIGGQTPNLLLTTFRVATPDDRSLLQSITDCAEPMAEDFFARLR